MDSRKPIEVYDVGMLDYEYCEYICEDGNWCKVEEVRELEKYRDSLEEQIEKMKCCGNCGQEFGTNGKCYFFTCKIGYSGGSDDNWQLK